MSTESESKIDIEYIKKYIIDCRDTITIDYHDGRWIVENTKYVNPDTNTEPSVKISGVGTTIETALDNFAYWYKISLGTTKVNNWEDYRDYF